MLVIEPKISCNRRMHVSGEACFLNIHISRTRHSSSCLLEDGRPIFPQELKRCCRVTSTKARSVALTLLNIADIALYITYHTQASKSHQGHQTTIVTLKRHLTACAVTTFTFAKSLGQLPSRTIRLLVKLLLLPDTHVERSHILRVSTVQPYTVWTCPSLVFRTHRGLCLLRHPHVFQPYLVLNPRCGAQTCLFVEQYP